LTVALAASVMAAMCSLPTGRSRPSTLICDRSRRRRSRSASSASSLLSRSGSVNPNTSRSTVRGITTGQPRAEATMPSILSSVKSTKSPANDASSAECARRGIRQTRPSRSHPRRAGRPWSASGGLTSDPVHGAQLCGYPGPRPRAPRVTASTGASSPPPPSSLGRPQRHRDHPFGRGFHGLDDVALGAAVGEAQYRLLALQLHNLIRNLSD
jgi:hypothetical protein